MCHRRMDDIVPIPDAGCALLYTVFMPESSIATFGAGCFWGVEDVFMQVDGVTDTAVGYMGGTLENPTYEMVCTDRTGHAEVVQVTYDPSKVRYADLLKIFWENHNPTTMNRQGPDSGSQYRSVIFYHTPEQKREAEESKQEIDASGMWKNPVVTAIEPAQTFWRAEEYHQKYHLKNGGSCHV
jgi:peptide-methionine (S)-S-oxide reductase